MKTLSMRTRLLLLCGFFLLMILGTNIFESFTVKKIVGHMDEIGKVQLPAVRKMTLIDMYHDGLVGIVYKTIHAGLTDNAELLKETTSDFAEMKGDMTKLFDEISLLPISQNAKDAIEKSKPALDKYLKTAADIIDLVGKGQNSAASAMLVDFNKSFSLLETELGVLGELIEKDADVKRELGSQAAEEGKNISFYITISSLVIGSIASFIIIKSFMGGIAQAVEVLSANVHDVQNTSQVVMMVSKRLSSSVNSQASSITQSVSAMDEISSMIQNNGASANNALNLSTQTKNSVESGKLTVNKMQNEMKKISESYDDIYVSVNKNKEDISRIVEVFNQISQKTQVINDIVFQTKLLSFNASVEAARAGETGKGFAVVAEEIGNLAVMSGKAAKDIEEMLGSSLQEVKAIAESTTRSIGGIVDSGRNKIQSGNEVSKDCLKDLDQILNYSIELDNSINEISNAIREQSQGVQEVNNSLKHLDGLTNETSELAEKSKNAGDSFKLQSHALRITIQELRKILGAVKNYDVEPLKETTTS